MAERLKLIGALLLAACFALPMASCTEYRDANGGIVVVERGGKPAADLRAVVTRHYLHEEFIASEPLSWLGIAAFMIPALIWLHARKWPAARVTHAMWFAEPFFPVVVLFMVWYMTQLYDDPDSGSYVAIGGVAIYFSGWLAEASSKWRVWRQRRAPAGAGNGASGGIE